MFDERKKEQIKFYKKISQTVKEYESAVINTALDSLKLVKCLKCQKLLTWNLISYMIFI